MSPQAAALGSPRGTCSLAPRQQPVLDSQPQEVGDTGQAASRPVAKASRRAGVLRPGLFAGPLEQLGASRCAAVTTPALRKELSSDLCILAPDRSWGTGRAETGRLAFHCLSWLARGGVLGAQRCRVQAWLSAGQRSGTEGVRSATTEGQRGRAHCPFCCGWRVPRAFSLLRPGHVLDFESS